MKRRNLLAAVLSFSLVIGMSAPVDLAQESKKTQTAVSIEDSVGETSKYGYLPIHRKLLNSDDLSSGRKKKAAKTIAYGSAFNIKNMVNVSSSYASSDALLKSMKVKGKVNTKKAGTYKVQCTITDPYTAVSVTKTFTFTISSNVPPAASIV